MIGAVLPLLAGVALALPQVDREFAIGAGGANWRTGSASYDLFIDPTGKVADCTSLYADEPSRSGRACRALIGKTVDQPARGPDGQPVHALFSVGYLAGTATLKYGRRDLELPSDLMLSVQRLPGGKRNDYVFVMAMVDESGRVTECAHLDGEDAALSATACDQARTRTMTVRRDGSRAVPYLTDLKVEFTVG